MYLMSGYCEDRFKICGDYRLARSKEELRLKQDIRCVRPSVMYQKPVKVLHCFHGIKFF